MTRPRTPLVPAQSPDEDPTGVRALLSSLPAPDPMPEHLVERINASLAAEHAQRAAGAPGASVSPLLATRRGRRGRLVFAAAGAAAAVALVTVVGNGLVQTGSTTSADRLTSTSTSSPEAAAGAATSGTKPLAPASAPGAGGGPQFNAQNAPAAGVDLGGAPAAAAASSAALTPTSALKTIERFADAPSSGPIVAIRQSETRYTQSDFVKQARALENVGMLFTPQDTAASSSVGPAGTPSGLRACLGALGAGAAQLVLADEASYEGQPAVIIVATTKGTPIAFAVKPQCSKAGPEVLRPATRLR